MSQSLTETSECTDDDAGVQYLQIALFNSFIHVEYSEVHANTWENVLMYKNRIYVQDIFYWDKKEHNIKISLLSDFYLNNKKNVNKNQCEWKIT